MFWSGSKIFFCILVELNVAAIIVITRAVLPGVIPTAILSPLAIESVSVASEKAPDVKRPIVGNRPRGPKR